MSGAYDALNTFIPYSNPLYMDYRPVLKVEPEQVLAVDDKVGFHPAMAPLKALYDEGKVAVLQGIGYPNPIRSHFRSMDIWHTAEPAKMVTDGWLGRAIRDLDPHKENILTAASLREREIFSNINVTGIAVWNSILNEEFLVIAIHYIALITSLPFVHTAKSDRSHVVL